MPVPSRDIGYFDKVNYVIDAWARPCDAPWYIYVNCLKPAALTAFITLIMFGWDDVARGYFRPRGLGPRRTGKRKGKWLRRIPRFPELGEMLGSKLPGAEEVKGVKWNSLGKTLWRIDTIMQQYLFWWLVADVTIDFAYNFTSVLYETRWCEASAKGRFSYRMGTTQLISPDRWFNLAYISKDYEFPHPAWIGQWGVTGVNGATVGFSVNIDPWNPLAPPISYSSRLRDVTTGAIISESGPNPPDVGGSSVNIESGDLGAGRTFMAEVYCEGAWGRATDGAITGMEN